MIAGKSGLSEQLHTWAPENVPAPTYCLILAPVEKSGKNLANSGRLCCSTLMLRKFPGYGKEWQGGEVLFVSQFFIKEAQNGV